jgi:16S rRNA (guanine966-N2)-methyltransferase
MRGRTMLVPDIEGLRPTPSRAREALFNMLGDMQGDSVLDLFAGSGVVGLEALSRGATSLLSIEGDRDACKAMKAIQESWAVEGWDIQSSSLPKALPEGRHFNFIYADPPYDKGLAEQVPQWLAKRKISYDTLVIEEASRTRIQWKGEAPVKQRKYSETTLYFFEPSADESIVEKV